MTLRTQLATDLRSILNTDEFAEQFTYIPKIGPARTVTGDVVRSAMKEDETNHATRTEVATVTCSRDPDDSTLGGIDNPIRGDKIRLSDGAEFSFTKKITDIDSAALVLEFERKSPMNLGKTR